MRSVLFDMDGVLIDVRKSYLSSIQKTVIHFSQGEISLLEIQSYRNRGGLNNDWDLCEAVLQDRGLKPQKQEIISVFQSVYLGCDFSGLINQETAFIQARTLQVLSRRFALGIVTGRPRPEAEFTLKKLGLWSFFPVCITSDDMPPGKGKPHPYGLILAAKRLGATQAFYIGDTVDDVQAALSAGMRPLGVVQDAQNRSRQEHILRQEGASTVLDDVNKINEVLK